MALPAEAGSCVDELTEDGAAHLGEGCGQHFVAGGKAIAKDSRRYYTLVEDAVAYGEDPFICRHCQSETETVTVFDDGVRREQCLHCGQTYDVTDELEEVFDADEEAVEEEVVATQADLNHSIAKDRKPDAPLSPYGELFGSF